jgi:phenylpropionate dioxygenase-like ring-hydroxylating dioxygenase large terminal subunit
VIRNQWYAILESSEVQRGKPVGVTRMGEKLVLWRDATGAVACMSDHCPHRGAALSVGRLVGDCIECPFHGFLYDPGGRCQLIPANGRGATVPKAFRLETYPAREAQDLIYIWWGEPQDVYPPLPFFDTIDEAFSYSTVRDHWTVHYSRAIENQLDVVHLPFVHKTTIGRGNRALVNGPFVRWDRDTAGEVLNLWVHNVLDEGRPALKPSELPEPTGHPSLQFRLPNVWHNWISDTVRIFAAFAPIDGDNTMLYVRFYQKSIRLPILRDIYTALASPSNRLILGQDKRVVLTQLPKQTDLKMGEKLIQGDGPIVAYRRRRRELIDAGVLGRSIETG